MVSAEFVPSPPPLENPTLKNKKSDPAQRKMFEVWTWAVCEWEKVPFAHRSTQIKI